MKPFSGELDKPKYVEFKGKLDYPEARSIPEGTPIGSGREETAQMVGPQVPSYKLPYPGPSLSREQKRAALPIMGGAVGASLGPGGMTEGALAGQALTGAVGYGLGELGRQKVSGEPTDLNKAAIEGGKFGAGSFVGGNIFKGIAYVANKAFVRGAQGLEEWAANYAQKKDLPYLGDPRTKIGKSVLAGEMYIRGKAHQVADYINRTMGELSGTIKSLDAADEAVDSAVAAGRQYFDDALKPGMVGIKEPFQKIRGALGDSAPIPLNKTAQGLDDALAWMESQGTKTGSLYKKIKNLRATFKPGDTKALDDLDELYGELWALWNKSTNRYARKAVETATKSIVEDIDQAAISKGITGFGEDFAQAVSKRAEFRQLVKDNPEFNKLLKIRPEQTRLWLNTLFTSSGKALDKIKEASPEVYNDLSNAWLGRQLWSNTTQAPSGFGTVLDGKRFYEWASANKKNLVNVFGKDKASSILEFSKYASSSTEALKNIKPSFSPTELMARGSSEAAALYYAPVITVTGEGTALALAYGLTNPNSTLFRLFTKGVSEGTSKTLSTALKIGGGVAITER